MMSLVFFADSTRPHVFPVSFPNISETTDKETNWCFLTYLNAPELPLDQNGEKSEAGKLAATVSPDSGQDRAGKRVKLDALVTARLSPEGGA